MTRRTWSGCSHTHLMLSLTSLQIKMVIMRAPPQMIIRNPPQIIMRASPQMIMRHPPLIIVRAPLQILMKHPPLILIRHPPEIIIRAPPHLWKLVMMLLRRGKHWAGKWPKERQGWGYSVRGMLHGGQCSETRSEFRIY